MNVLIIEDNLIWQLRVQMMVEELGYTIANLCSSSKEVIAYLAIEQPDLIIADIVLKDELVFVLRAILEEYQIPCIFMTSALTENNYEQAKNFLKTRLLVKPFHILALQNTIESLSIVPGVRKQSNGIFVTGKLRQKILIPFREILFLEAEGNYSTINTIQEKRYVIKKALAQIASDLDTKFLQVQRALFINVEYINRVDFSKEELNLNGKAIKIGRKYRNAIATYINYREVKKV